MKMTKEHFAILKEALNKVMEESPLVTPESYARHGFSVKRYAWDCLHYAKKYLPHEFLCDHLYLYLNDNHIDTALIKIVGEYHGK
jgi:hypothetical protein